MISSTLPKVGIFRVSRLLSLCNFAERDDKAGKRMQNLLANGRTGKSISEHFILGEDHFRKVEQQTLHNASTDSKFILSTGGGTPCFHGNMEWMNRNGITVYLKLDPLSLFHRLKASKRPRPLLEGKSDDELLDFIKSNLAEREPVYRQARYQVKGEDLDVLSLVNNINMGERQLR
ncbi:MAG: shikimate kinase [Bacteroidota bacterium]